MIAIRPPRLFQRFFVLAAQTLLILLSVSSYASACSCSAEVEAPACQLISRTEVVFLGECLELVGDPNGGVFRFRVDRVYKGLAPSTREVLLNPMSGTSCQAEYPTGKSYLMFAQLISQQPLALLAGECSGSRRADLNKADVAFLESYLQGKTETAVFGRVLQWVTGIGLPREKESAALAGASVVLQNQDHRFTAASDLDGSYRFSGIPPGEYQLSASLDPFIPDPISYQVSVTEGACKQVFVQLKANASIGGVLLAPDGRPAQRMRVELLRRNHEGDWYSTYKMWAQTDEQGRFHFTDIESGEYLLGYEIWHDSPSQSSPYPTTYYPKAGSRSKAEIIPLAPGQSLNDLKVMLPPPHAPRVITIRVVGADGKPPGENLLQVFDGRALIKNLQGKGHNGVLTFMGYQEREYEFSARYWVDNLSGGGPVFSKRIAKTDKIKLAPGKGPAEIKLVLNRIVLRGDDR
jgi:hypothetical protein